MMKNKNIELPKDIKRHCVNSLLKRVIICILLFVALLTAIVMWGDILLPLDERYSGFKKLCWLVILSLPFIITKIPVVIFDKTYSGVVKTVDIETTPDTTRGARPTIETVYMKNTIVLTVETLDGKEFRKKVYADHANDAQHLNTFEKGDYVVHLRGKKHTVILPKPSSTHCICAVCGAVNETTNSCCSHCKHTIIKNF